MLVHLQCRGCPHVVDAIVNAVMESASLLRTIADNENLTCCHYGTYTNGECLLWNEINIIVEETAVCLNGVGGECLNTRLA